MYTIALVDDHVLFRQGLAGMIHSFDEFHICIQASNGKDLLHQLQLGEPVLPDLVILDISMPVMDGFETAAYLQQHYPCVKVLALSMRDDENAIIRMIKNGAKGYILKDCEPDELKTAIYSIITKGFYYSDLVSGRLIFSINKMGLKENQAAVSEIRLSPRELEFMQLVCSELTYKEIAGVMAVSIRTVDGYRDCLFEKLELKSRVGLVLYAIKNGIYKA